jgi:hypothetical protein
MPYSRLAVDKSIFPILKIRKDDTTQEIIRDNKKAIENFKRAAIDHAISL